MTPLVQVPAVPSENTKALSAIEQAKAFQITTQEERAAVDSFCVNLKALEKEVDAAYDEHIKAAHAAHKSLVAKKASYGQPIIEARNIAKGKLIAWDAAEAQRCAVEEARLRDEARKRAEDEALAKAERAAEFGDDKTADAIISAPVVVAPVVMPEAPKSQTVLQTRWKFRITNAALIPREYLVPDEKAIGGVVRSTKGAVAIPGIEAYSERV